MRRYRPPLSAFTSAGCLVAALVVSTRLVAVADAATEDMRPVRARVASPGAPVRSGPGDSYYLTDTLPEDTAVEVYRRQPDGWCAIRPPAESFSWVYAQNLRLSDDGLAEVVHDDAAARVGSRLSAQRDVVQVRLKRGETVAVLGRDEREGGLWYKIAPPAGEFRWIHSKDIGLGGTLAENTENNARPVTTASHEEPANNKTGDLRPVDVAAPPLATAEAVASPSVKTEPKVNADQWSAAKSAPPVADITPIGPGAATSAELTDHLRELELRLSRMVSEPPATWNVAPLEQAAEQLLSRADSVADRNAVKVTLAKIDQFSAIQRRYANMSVAPAGSSPTALVAAAAAPAGQMTSPSAGPIVDANGPYDAVGILRPVVSRRPGAPQFALVNSQGQVVTFVTPAPDVNLQPFIGQRIGVTGSRGYIPEFRRAHVTAGRVAPLNDRILR